MPFGSLAASEKPHTSCSQCRVAENPRAILYWLWQIICQIDCVYTVFSNPTCEANMPRVLSYPMECAYNGPLK